VGIETKRSLHLGVYCVKLIVFCRGTRKTPPVCNEVFTVQLKDCVCRGRLILRFTLSHLRVLPALRAWFNVNFLTCLRIGFHRKDVHLFVVFTVSISRSARWQVYAAPFSLSDKTVYISMEIRATQIRANCWPLEFCVQWTVYIRPY
jgi:hypothetical protein